MRVYYDRDADINLIKNKKVVIVIYNIIIFLNYLLGNTVSVQIRFIGRSAHNCVCSILGANIILSHMVLHPTSGIKTSTTRWIKATE